MNLFRVKDQPLLVRPEVGRVFTARTSAQRVQPREWCSAAVLQDCNGPFRGKPIAHTVQYEDSVAARSGASHDAGWAGVRPKDVAVKAENAQLLRLGEE